MVDYVNERWIQDISSIETQNREDARRSVQTREYIQRMIQ